jgi:hypothetical protein
MYSICCSAEFFHPKNGLQKMLGLCGPAAEKLKVVKSPAHAAKNAENGAFLAHLEPKILLIEVAYFLAATEYTFSLCRSAEFFHQKNGQQKCWDFCGPAAEKPKVVKSWFFLSQKSPAHAAKNAENGAFLAHLEPEILLIEVAYFSAATEYTFSAHCTYKVVKNFFIIATISNALLAI